MQWAKKAKKDCVQKQKKTHIYNVYVYVADGDEFVKDYVVFLNSLWDTRQGIPRVNVSLVEECGFK